MPFEKFSTLPRIVYVTWEEGSDDPWLSVSEDRDSLVEASDRRKVTVGTYRLEKVEHLMTTVVPARRVRSVMGLE